MGMWWLVVAAIWRASRGGDFANALHQNETSLSLFNNGLNSTAIQDVAEKQKRGVSLALWDGKQAFGAHQTKKIPRFSSWGGKRNSESSEKYVCPGSNLQCLIDHVTEHYLKIIQAASGEGYSNDHILEEKRGKFSSWGGKRADLDYGEDTDSLYWTSTIGINPIENEKRKISSWGGKRLSELANQKRQRISNWNNRNTPLYIGPKRAKFSSWGGKRSSNEDVLDGGTKRTRFSSWGGKRMMGNGLWNKERRAKFSSWGGKRDGGEEDWSALEEDKRSKFSAWGGKRNDGEDDPYSGFEKRAKFSSWGGKRSDEDADTDDSIDKRAKFSSWGGKRSNEDYQINNNNDKRSKFSAWGGKRNDEETDSIDKRAKFSSWGGKRSDEENQLSDIFDKEAAFSSWGGKSNDEENQLSDSFDKRAKFSSWGGKRSDEDNQLSDNFDKRAKLSSWGGKRSDEENQLSDSFDKRAKFSSWGGKRGNSEIQLNDEIGKRAKFSSWGGKRNDEEIYGDFNDLNKQNKFLSWGGKTSDDTKVSDNFEKRAKFSSWGGKRSGEEADSDLNFLNKRAQFSIWREKQAKPMDENMSTIMKRKFSSWGGKRSDNEDSDEQFDKRAKFSSWGGKRDYGENDGQEKNINFLAGKQVEPKSSFVSDFEYKWSKFPRFEMGKENHKVDMSMFLKDDEKRKFSSWGGKRDNVHPDLKMKFSNLDDWTNVPQEPKTPSLVTNELVQEEPANTSKENYNPIMNFHQIYKLCYPKENGELSKVLSSIAFQNSDHTLKDLRKIVLQLNGNSVQKYSYSKFEHPTNYDIRSNSNICLILEKILEKLHNENSLSNKENPRIPQELSNAFGNIDTSDEFDLDGRNPTSNIIESLQKKSQRYPPLDGKRRTPFSSWGGKRNFVHGGEPERHNIKKRSVQKSLVGKPKKVKEIFTNLKSLYSWNHKRSVGTKKTSMNRFFSKGTGVKDGSWSAVLRPIRRGSDFYPWGGKRSS